MANRSRPTLLKREREKARVERQKQKTARRLEAKARRDAAPRRSTDEDPDIAGIRLGPQPRAEWQDDAEE
jgi:hypothetical protein